MESCLDPGKEGSQLAANFTVTIYRELTSVTDVSAPHRHSGKSLANGIPLNPTNSLRQKSPAPFCNKEPLDACPVFWGHTSHPGPPHSLTLFTLEGFFPDVARRALTAPFRSLLRSRGVRLLGEGVLRAEELTVGSRSRTGLSFSTKVSLRGLGFTRRGPGLSPARSRSCRAHCSSCAASRFASSRTSSIFAGLRRPKLNRTPWGAGAAAFRSPR